MSRLFKLPLFLLLAITLLGCGLFTPASTSTPEVDPAVLEREEQAVYASFFVHATGTVVLLRDTSTTISNGDTEEYVQGIASELPGLSDETLASFVDRNSTPGQLSPNMNIGVDYVLLSPDKLAQITSQPNWGEVLNEMYPNSGGYKIFSRVGFNSTLDQAMLYVGHVAGPMMGGGFYYLMEKKDGRWSIIKEYMVWIS
jgi:hypothetical protein